MEQFSPTKIPIRLNERTNSVNETRQTRYFDTSTVRSSLFTIYVLPTLQKFISVQLPPTQATRAATSLIQAYMTQTTLITL